ncbi:DNA sulfur modification protein DndB [Geothermobacter hydrogeniphilus]|uniref:DNA sulfur modification protein DndB n=1 Tax=Geothermobacter hydrogeniphilus TaxID=1969733 RepID=A0A2K2H6I1_9BACT|nr:DNA sulfur modification protein DndB [Geothermobacter hydrogeniphilus]PNU18823.1 DNA sulfur modification protein DndB [Geothermobacter hydrogeniphilus]
MDPNFQYIFPAIRGIQAKREYYVSMCPLHLIPKIFIWDEEVLPPELRAQRILNKSRVPEMARYLTEGPENYVFSAITASIDADVTFEAIGEESNNNQVGVLRVPMSARFIINDGQHRRAAIEMALHEQPDLGNETIAVVFFLDRGLTRCQQMFADLNRYAVRPSRSLGLLYDHRDEMASVAKLVALKSKAFKDVVEMEKSTLSARSRKLFTLSAIYTGTSALLSNIETESEEERASLAIEFWDEVDSHVPEWGLVRERKITSGEVRQDFIHSHGVALHALGKVGNELLRKQPRQWKTRLKKLATIDWSRSNSEFWEGRALVIGRVSKANQSVTLTTNILKKHLAIPLKPEEQEIEEAFLRGDDV